MRERTIRDVEGELRKTEEQKRNALAAVEKIGKEDAVHNTPTELDVPIALENKLPRGKRTEAKKIVTMEELQKKIDAEEVSLDLSSPLPNNPEKILDMAETKTVKKRSELSVEQDLQKKKVAQELFGDTPTVLDGQDPLDATEFETIEVMDEDIIDERDENSGLLAQARSRLKSWFG